MDDGSLRVAVGGRGFPPPSPLCVHSADHAVSPRGSVPSGSVSSGSVAASFVVGRKVGRWSCESAKDKIRFSFRRKSGLTSIGIPFIERARGPNPKGRKGGIPFSVSQFSSGIYRVHVTFHVTFQVTTHCDIPCDNSCDNH